MLNDTDTLISNVIKKIVDDFGPAIFADKKKALAVIADYFSKNNITDEKMLVDHAIKTGIIEIIVTSDKSNYADCRKKALQILTEEQFIAKKWADKLLLWFDEALSNTDITQLAQESENCEEANTENINTEYINPVDAILDENNCDNVFLYDEDGTATEFEQIAVVPVKDNICAILRPVVTIPGMKEGEALVFVIDEFDDGEEFLYVTENESLIDEVFDIYYKMLEESDTDES